MDPPGRSLNFILDDKNAQIIRNHDIESGTPNNEAADGAQFNQVEKGRDPEECSGYAVDDKIDPEQGEQGNLDIGASNGTSCRSRNISQMSTDSWGGELSALPSIAKSKFSSITFEDGEFILEEEDSSLDESDTKLRKKNTDITSSMTSAGESKERLPAKRKCTSSYMTKRRSWRWYCFVVFYFIQGAGSVLFLYWLLTGAWNHSFPAVSILYFSAEVIAFVSMTLSLFTGLFRTEEEKMDEHTHQTTIQVDESEKPHVAVCICRYKEPIEDLFLSLECILDIDYPTDKLHVYILDDGFFALSKESQVEQMEGLALMISGSHLLGSDPLASFQCQSTKDLLREDCAVTSNAWQIRSMNMIERRCEVTLIARTKPANSHYKAGNINNFLYNYCGSRSKVDSTISLMLILDHDMIPAPNVINEALPRFLKHDELAFVQYPQRFFDIVTDDRFHSGNEMFFDGVCENRSRMGLAAFAGTNAIWRLSALYSVGGLQYGSLTEDANTGLAVHKQGWTSEYISKELCVGQSPQNLADAMRQRMRWSHGSIQILMNSLLCCRKVGVQFPCPQVLAQKYRPPKLKKRLSLSRHISVALVYLDNLIYPFYSYGFILHAVVCLLYLITEESPMAPSKPLHILFFWLPLYSAKMICQSWAFPLVSLQHQIDSQKAWAGYAFTTVWSINEAISQAVGLKSAAWFNTGSGTKRKDWFLLQYGNSVFFIVINLAMIYRAVAFTFLESACEAWLSVGALMYGIMLSWMLKDWALEPFLSAPVESSESVAPRESIPLEITTGQEGQKNTVSETFSMAMRDSVKSNTSKQRKRLAGDDDDSSFSSKGSFISLLTGMEPGAEERSLLKTNMAQNRIRELISKREAYERHSPNLSVSVNIISVLVVIVLLFVWSVFLNDSSRWTGCSSMNVGN